MNRPSHLPRRRFLLSTSTAGLAAATGGLGRWMGIPSVSAADADLDPALVRFAPDIEPLVRLLEETPRDRLLEEIGARVRRGASYREVLAALLLAGVRNVEPRPVGFKFHAVLVVNSAHLASLASPDSDRWLPIFWALDNFKESQARNEREGDWHLRRAREDRVPTAAEARTAFVRAMEHWDVEAADAAVVGLARSNGAQSVFDLFCRFGARDFRDIGHKAIYVTNSWRTLQCIGWRHAEPVLRSLAYALLAHEGSNPAERDAEADRPGRRNLERAAEFRTGWSAGRTEPEASRELVSNLRTADPDAASALVAAMIQRGIDPRSLWDGLFAAAGELLMERPGIVALHAVTTANAMHHAWRVCGEDMTRRFLLLQLAAFLPMFRRQPMPSPGLPIDQWEPPPQPAGNSSEVETLFRDITGNRSMAARRLHAFLEAGGDAEAVIAEARRLIFLKGTNAHDYKFSSAVLEDFHQLSPTWRNRFLASSVFQLRGSGDADNGLVDRIRSSFSSSSAAVP